MKRILSYVLCSVLAVSTALVPASAVETEIELSGEKSQKDSIINALLHDESWVKNAGGFEMKAQFVDLDFDGNLEFVTETFSHDGFLTTNAYNISVDDYDGLAKTSGTFESAISPENLVGYYDAKSGNYRMIGSSDAVSNASTSLGIAAYHYDYEVLPQQYNTRIFSNKSIAYYKLQNGETTYYDGNGNVISESEYNAICSDYVSGLINVNVKFDSYTAYDMDNANIYSNLTTDEKRVKLEELYDSFTYDKIESKETEDPSPNVVKETYTAEELVNKTVPEIIEIMGGHYQYGGRTLGTSIEPLFVMTNPETLPGFIFVLDGLTSDQFEKNKFVEAENIRSGKYDLECILISDTPNVVGAGKLDENISADMRYNDLTKYYGDFSVIGAGAEAAVYVYNNYLSITFSVDELKNYDSVNYGYTVETMKAANPKIKEICVKPGYVSKDYKKVYTAEKLVNKTIPEIIEIMGGKYQCHTGDSAADLTTVNFEDNINVLVNESEIPGMKFCWKEMLTNGFDADIISNLENGKYPLYAIQVTGSAKADDKISADMSYSDCAKVLGSFDCELSYLKTYNGKEKTISYSYENDGATVILNFEIDSSLQKKIDAGQTKFTASEMSEINPKLRNIEVFKNVSSDTDTNTESDSENSDTSTNNSGNNSSSSGSSGTSNSGSSSSNGKSADAVSTGVVTTGISAIVLVLAVSGAVVIISRKRREN